MRNQITAILLAFGIVIAAPAKSQEAMPTVDEMMEVMAELFVPELQRLLEPGEKVEGWNQRMDMVGLLAGMDGGLEGNMLVETDPEGKIATRYFGRAFDSAMLPDDWELVKSKGTIDLSGAGTMMEIFEYDGPFVLVLNNRYEMEGTAICTKGVGGYQLFRRPGKAEVMPEPMILGLIRSVEIAFADRTVCETHQAYDEYFVPGNFDGQGHSLPKLDEDIGTVVAMRYRPFAELLGN